MQTMKHTFLAVAAALLLAGAFATAASAVVPPRNCGFMTVKGKRWQVKADQIRCTTAKRYAASYIRSYAVPRYYRCQRGPSGSSLWRKCSAARYNPDRVFHIIRR